MQSGKAINKKRLLIEHRRERYNHAIQELIDGKATRAYVEYRWNKLQEALGKKKR